MIVDGESGPQFDHIFYPVFSPDSRRLAYCARNGNRQFVVADGVAGPEYDEIHRWFPMFTNDSRHLLYWARRGEKWLLVVDGREDPEYDWTYKTGIQADGSFEYLAVRDGVLYRVTHSLSAG